MEYLFGIRNQITTTCLRLRYPGLLYLRSIGIFPKKISLRNTSYLQLGLPSPLHLFESTVQLSEVISVWAREELETEVLLA